MGAPVNGICGSIACCLLTDAIVCVCVRYYHQVGVMYREQGMQDNEIKEKGRQIGEMKRKRGRESMCMCGEIGKTIDSESKCFWLSHAAESCALNLVL